MKKILYFILIVILINIFNYIYIYAQPRLEYGEPLKTYTGESGLNIISYCSKWSTEKKLKEVYDELLNNFNSSELYYLSKIYIYPDSPEGVSGYYNDDAIIGSDGKYTYGNNAYIEIFNADEYYDISQMASVLAHEYGHHFTFYHIITNENKYYNQWYDTQYAKIRQLDKYKDIIYESINTSEDTYSHEWDITEIAAEDYVQLFASKLAKESTDYKDISERLKEDIDEYYYLNSSYNLLPQENLNIPLATDVNNLYTYWLNIAGYTSTEHTINNKPIPYIKEVKEVYFGGNKRYTVAWNDINDSNIYEYTVIMHASGMPYFPIPIKTVKTGEEMTANIGSDVKIGEDGEPYGILEIFDGEYEIKIFIKDVNGFIFSSETLYYDFTNEKSRYNEGIEEYILSNIDYSNINKRIIKSDYIKTYPQNPQYKIENTNHIVASNFKNNTTSNNLNFAPIKFEAIINYDNKGSIDITKIFKKIPAKRVLNLKYNKFSSNFKKYILAVKIKKLE